MKKTGRPSGRPRMPEGVAKSYTFQVRLSVKDRELVNRAAGSYGVKVSVWARNALLQAANARLSAFK